jgi:hypothetical protein
MLTLRVNQGHLKVFRAEFGHPTAIAVRPRRGAIEEREINHGEKAMSIRRMRAVLVALLVAILSSAFAVGANADNRTDEMVNHALGYLHDAWDALHHNKFSRDDREEAIHAIEATRDVLTDYLNKSQ